MNYGETESDKRGDTAKWRNLTLLWGGVIFATSCTVVQSKAFIHAVSTSTPVAISESGFQRFWASWWWVFVKGYHVLEFALFTGLLCLWLRRRPLWLLALVGAAYAASDEIHQLWVPQRGGRVSDWLIDLIGVAIAMGLAAWQRRLPPSKAPMGPEVRRAEPE